MEDKIVINIKRERAHLNFWGNNIEVELVFTVHDIDSLYDINLFHDGECEAFVKNLICRHIVGYTQIETKDISEECCIEYINLFLHSDNAIEEIYKSLDESLSPCRRFLLAHKELMNQRLENLKPVFLSLSESIRDIAESYTKSFEPIVESLKSLIDQYVVVYDGIINDISEQVRTLADVFSNISIPTLSEESKQQIINRYVLWGDYGWTSTEFLSQDLMEYQPADLADANRFAMDLFNKQTEEKLFEQIERLGSIDKSDLIELKNSYHSENYKACVLISFAMIDAKLIHSQGEDINRRPGNTGISRLEAKITRDVGEVFLLTLSVTNLLHCLRKMFEDSANFSKQPVVINRHFIAHGMLDRKVTKTDAIQTALLVYNLYSLTDDIEKMKENKQHDNVIVTTEE